MASLIVGSLIALAAAASSSSKKSDAPRLGNASHRRQPVSGGTVLPDVYIPEASQDKHPANLPTHTPVYGAPETAPEMANAYNWKPDAWAKKNTGSFEDQFHEFTEDSPSTIKNSNMPDGLVPHFKRKTQSTYYTEPLTPYEYKPPKAEIPFEQLHGSPWIAQNNVDGAPPSYLYDDRYAQMSLKENTGLGGRDGYSLWDDPVAAAAKSKQDIELGDAESEYFTGQGDGTQGWFGTRGITQRFEGYHPRDRIFPYKESFMSTNPQLYDRPGVPDIGPEGNVVPQMGRYEMPDNTDVTEYHVESLPTASVVDAGPRLGAVVLKNTYRESTNIPYAGNGGDELDATSDVCASKRVNGNIPPVTKKQLLTNTASSMNFMNYDETDKLVGRNPIFNYTLHKVTPQIIQDIDESLIKPHLANPFTEKITNLQYPMNLTCGKVEATTMPAYASA